MQLVQTTMRSMQGVTEGEVVVATTVGLRRICFVYANPARRWSLRMIKWWSGWGVLESTETLIRFQLSLTVRTMDSKLAD